MAQVTGGFQEGRGGGGDWEGRAGQGQGPAEASKGSMDKVTKECHLVDDSTNVFLLGPNEYKPNWA